MLRRGARLLALLVAVTASSNGLAHAQRSGPPAPAAPPVPRADLAPAGLQETITADRLQETVGMLGAVIAREYFDAATGTRIDRALHERLDAGAYGSFLTRDALARALTTDLYVIAHDKHLAVIARPQSTSGPNRSTPPESRSDAARRDNGGVRRVEILAGNVGYLDIRYFWRRDEATQAVDAAMQLLGRADALVVDMRNNSGGSPETVAHLASYLVDGPATTLFQITPRRGPVASYATEAVSARDGRRPLYVLTSSRSFSGAEGFAFLLQERGRAEVIGEPTPGAANPGRPYPVNDLVDVVVPNGRLLTVPGGRNWEGTGVTPDLEVAAKDALPVAHERALRRLLQGASSDAERQRLQNALSGVAAERK